MFLLIFLCAFIILLIIFEIKHRNSHWYLLAKQIPGPKILPLIGNLWTVLFKDQEETFYIPRLWANKYKENYRYYMPFLFVYQVIRGNDTELLLANSQLIDKSYVYDFLHPLMGTGLLCSTKQKWHVRRRILTPTFHFNILQQFQNTFNEESAKFVKIIHDKLSMQNGKCSIHLQTDVPNFTINTICETAMGVKLDETKTKDKYMKSIYEIGSLMVRRLLRPWLYSTFTYTISGQMNALNKILKPIHEFTRDIIKKRRQLFLINQQNNNNEDNEISESNSENFAKYDEYVWNTKKQRYAMLDTLLAAEADNKIDEEGIREEVDTFMFEGYETTGSCIMYTLLALANYQGIQERLYQEVIEHTADKSELVISDFNNMRYLDAVIKESLRLYPPVPFISRANTTPLKLSSGLTLPIGTVIHFHIYDLHRDPDVFEDPELFDPERFMINKQYNPFSYIPFSAGIRNCIGQKFALLEIKTILVNIVKNFHLNKITDIQDIRYLADLVLRSKTELYVDFTPRR